MLGLQKAKALGGSATGADRLPMPDFFAPGGGPVSKSLHPVLLVYPHSDHGAKDNGAKGIIRTHVCALSGHTKDMAMDSYNMCQPR